MSEQVLWSIDVPERVASSDVARAHMRVILGLRFHRQQHAYRSRTALIAHRFAIAPGEGLTSDAFATMRLERDRDRRYRLKLVEFSSTGILPSDVDSLRASALKTLDDLAQAKLDTLILARSGPITDAQLVEQAWRFSRSSTGLLGHVPIRHFRSILADRNTRVLGVWRRSSLEAVAVLARHPDRLEIVWSAPGLESLNTDGRASLLASALFASEIDEAVRGASRLDVPGSEWHADTAAVSFARSEGVSISIAKSPAPRPKARRGRRKNGSEKE